MDSSVLKQVADLRNLSHEELVALWRTLYGKDPTASNRPYLIKRLAYRIQELAYGGLSMRARETMDTILDSHGFDENGGNPALRQKQQERRQGMPVTGTRIVREWKGKTHEVIAVHGGISYEGKLYRSLSAVAKAITGTHWNGPAFFGIGKHSKKKGKSSV